MRALVFHGPGKRAWEDKPKPSLRTAADAILRISETAAYECDLSILNGEIPNVPVGLTLGCEGIGTIEEIGSDVTRFKVGDKAMITHANKCGYICAGISATTKRIEIRWRSMTKPISATASPREYKEIFLRSSKTAEAP